MNPKAEKLTETLKFNISLSDRQWLDRTAKEGGFSSIPALVRSILRTVREDDERAHKERAA